MNANGCEFTLHAPSEGVNGSFDIGGAKCTAMTAQQAGTPISIPAQTGLAATFENEGSGTGAKIKVKAQAAIKYEVVGDGKGIRTGTYLTTWSLQGNQGGSPVGIRVQLFQGCLRSTAPKARCFTPNSTRRRSAANRPPRSK